MYESTAWFEQEGDGMLPQEGQGGAPGGAAATLQPGPRKVDARKVQPHQRLQHGGTNFAPPLLHSQSA